MEKIKVVSAKSMTKIEGIAYTQGCHELEFMENAGISIACYVEIFIQNSKLDPVVTLLVGKGNNGGDAYVAGLKLLLKGFRVTAFHLYPMDLCSPLCRHQKERFEGAGGVVNFVQSGFLPSFGLKGVLLDGLVGTGFKGSAEGLLAEVIRAANLSSLPILSIDIPSVLCGNTGAVGSVAIQATSTIYLELPKVGFFLGEGWNHVGVLVKGEFGLSSDLLSQVKPEAVLVNREDPQLRFLSTIKRSRNKYDAGYVLTIAGSVSMTGAGILSSYAALRSGAGIVRWFYPPEIELLITSTPWEIIKEPLHHLGRLSEEMKRAKALLMGPGMGRDKGAKKQIKEALSKCKIPLIIDADALFFLANNPSFEIPSQAILTPHAGEMKRLLEAHNLFNEPLLEGVQEFVNRKKATVLLKGAPNFLFTPGEVPLILPFGNPGMATAGMGDVLSGLLASLLAQGLSPAKAAIIGCYVHGVAGDLAASKKGFFGLTASDVLESLPEALSLNSF